MKKYLVMLIIAFGVFTNVYALEEQNKSIDILYSDIYDKGLEKTIRDKFDDDVKIDIPNNQNYPKTIKAGEGDSSYDVTVNYHGILVSNRNVELEKDNQESFYEITIENSEELINEGYNKEDIVINVSDNLRLENNNVYGKELGKGTVTITTKDNKYKTEIKVNVKEKKKDESVSTEKQDQTTMIKYKTHIQDIGWEQIYKKDGEMSGTTGESKRLEAIEIKLDSKYSGGIKYRTHIQYLGWENGYKKEGEISGTTGESKRLEAIQIELYGEIAEHYDVYYRVHIENIGWMNWAKNGQKAGSEGKSYRLEAIEVVLVNKGNNPPKRDNMNTDKKFVGLQLAYKTHIQNIGWQNYVYDGALAGTEGQSLRMEAINIELKDQQYSGDISYRGHVQDIGWMSFVKNGELTGTEGQSKRLEAIEIKLTGEMAEHYDVYYRVHVENIGWMNWAKNGEKAGSEGQSKRLEAVEIVLVDKGKEPPLRNNMNTNLSFVDRTGWQVIDGKKYYIYEDGSRAKYIAKVDGKRCEFTANGELQHENIKLVVDVSDHNKTIDWDNLWHSGEIDGAIVRVSAGAEKIDSKFEENMQAITRLNIPYGMYIYSYAENYDEGKYYAEFFERTAGKYMANASLGVYFDLESNGITSYLNTDNYNEIVRGFMNVIPNAKIYTYTDYSNNVLNSQYLLDLTTWIANYIVADCPGNYRGWQYTSKGKVTGISTNVDLSIFYY